MGGKSSTSTSTTGIPGEVLSRYNAVNAQAQNVAQTPFQPYSFNPNAFVAPLTSTQMAGIQNTNQTAGAAQPFYGVGTGLTLAGAGPVNAGQIGGQQIGQYMSPFLNSVVGTTMANLRQQQQQEQSSELGNQISRGAFGGDRGRIAQANLARQQGLATGQTVAGLVNQGYGQALQTAQQQQGVNLGAEQANQARLMQAGQQIAGLGAGAQAAGLQGAQAQLAAGTAEQQTNQAGQTALYNQYLQQQGYPFQVAQFLANIAMGTGALSGQTTTTQQPSSFFSDKRLKEDIEPIGETYDGQKIVKFRYKGEPGKQIGLIAQDVEKRHPEAVGLAGGYKTVDYDKATKHAADKGHYLHGGLVPQSEGGAVYEDRAGQGYAAGGEASQMAKFLALIEQEKAKTPYGKIGGPYGQVSSKAAGPYGSSLGLEDARSLAVRPVRELSLDDSRYVRAPAFAHGGLAPDGYASGGSSVLPYATDKPFVPESVTDSDSTPEELPKPPKTASGQNQSNSDLDTVVKIAKVAAMFLQNGGAVYASGGLVPHMAYGGSPDFADLLTKQEEMYRNMLPGAKGGVGGLNIPSVLREPGKYHRISQSPMASNVKSSTDQTMADLKEAGNATLNVKDAYNAGKEALFGSRGRPELRNQAGELVREEVKGGTGLFSSQNPDEPGYFKRLTDLFASGGLVPRRGYAEGGPDFNIPAVPEGVDPEAHMEIYNAAKAEQDDRDKKIEEARKLMGGLNVSDAQFSDPRPGDAERNASIKTAIDTINQNNPLPTDIDGVRSDAPPRLASLGTPASPPEIRLGLGAGDQASGDAQSALGRANLTDLQFNYKPALLAGLGAPPVVKSDKSNAPVGDRKTISGIRDVNFQPYTPTEIALVSIAQGLGNMVESPSRYLGSALFSGVKGGAKAYGEMQKEMSEAGKASQRIGVEQENVDALNLQRSLELMKYYTDGAEPFRNLKNEQMVRIPKLGKVMTLAEYQQQLSNVAKQAQGISSKFNADAFLAGTGAPTTGTGAPATGTGAGAPGARAGEPPVRGERREVLVDERMIADPNMRPTNIAAQIANYKQILEGERDDNISNPKTQEQIDYLQKRYDDILKGEILPLQADGTPMTAYKAAAARTAGETETSKVKTNEASSYVTDEAPNQDRAIQALMDVYASTEMGGKTPLIADIANSLRTIPAFAGLLAGNEWVSALTTGDATARKNAIDQAVSRVSNDLNSAPARGLSATLQTVADPSMPAGAKFNVLASQQATQNYYKDLYNSWIDTEPKPTWDKFSRDFNRTNSIEKYKDKVIDKMPIFAGMTPDDMFKFAKLNTPERISAALSTKRITLEQGKNIIKQNPNVFKQYLPEPLEQVN